MSSMTLPHQIPRAPGSWGSALLAVLMHSLLVLMLVFGIRWQSQAPVVVQAELWSALPQIAAPAPPPALPEPPQPIIEKPLPKIEPDPAPIQPDIALKQEKPKKPEPPKIEKPKPEPKPEPKPTPSKPVVNPVTPTVKPAQSIDELIKSAGAPSTGSDKQTSGPRGDSNYAGLIKAKILSNLRFPIPPDLVGNPEAVFLIDQLPTGEIASVRKTKSSGLPAFDAAVERAILASSPLPKNKDGRVTRQLEIAFTPLDKNAVP